MSIKDKLDSRLEEIYLGNLGTVESDLTLPNRTKGGSWIDWKSSNTAFLEHNGKVHRPRCSEGNQTVLLKATVKESQEIFSKEYKVTILAVPRERTFIRQFPMRFYIQVNTQFQLPSCVILELEDGIVSLPVCWENTGVVQVQEEAVYEVIGDLDMKDSKAINSDESFEMKYLIKNQPQKVKAHVIGAKESSLPQTKTPIKKVYEVPKSQVKLLGDDKFVQDIQRMLTYILSFHVDSLLYSFREAAGLPTKGGDPMLGWDAPESNLRGHTTGHYLSSIALAYEMTKDSRLEKQACELIHGLEAVQKKYTTISEAYVGYLSAYTIEQFEGLESGETYPTVWAPYYTLHKIMAGLLDCYQVFNNDTALSIVKQIGVWIYRRLSGFSKEQLNKIWSIYIAGEFGGINETLAELYLITGEEMFLKAAKLFDNDTLIYPMAIDIDILGGIHANQHIPQVIGVLKMFEATNKVELYQASYHFWDMVHSHHTYAIGGVGNTEMFHNPDCIGGELSEKTAESCCSYNMLKLSRKLFEYQPSAKYADYYEQVLLNHILANSCMEHGGMTTYFMGMQPGAQKNYHAAENTCCHGTGLESKFRYSEGIYFASANEIYVNLFMNAALHMEDGFVINQVVENEKRNQIRIEVIKGIGEVRTIKIRIPGWCNGEFEILHCKNKGNISVEDSYIVIREDWEADDYIQVRFSSSLRILRPKDTRDLFSIFYGPFILALLDESDDFIEFPQSQEDLIKSIRQIDDLSFQIDEYELKPLYQVVDEKYHIYMKNDDKEKQNG